MVEINQGGAMVETVLRAERAGLPLRQVRASRGKTMRAEPIAALYEQGRVSHSGAFPALEDQMVLFTPFGIEGGGAADRVDALVWALADLFPRMVKPLDNVAWDEDAGGGGAGSWLLSICLIAGRIHQKSIGLGGRSSISGNSSSSGSHVSSNSKRDSVAGGWLVS